MKKLFPILSVMFLFLFGMTSQTVTGSDRHAALTNASAVRHSFTLYNNSNKSAVEGVEILYYNDEGDFVDYSFISTSSYGETITIDVNWTPGYYVVGVVCYEGHMFDMTVWNDAGDSSRGGWDVYIPTHDVSTRYYIDLN